MNKSVFFVILALAVVASVAWEPTAAAQVQWTQVSSPSGATLKQVAVGNASAIYSLDINGVLYKWNGSSWDRKGCCVSQISVGSDGELWATNPPDSMRVLRWNGTAWTWNIPTGMKQVTVANAGNVYGLDNGGALFKWNGAAWVRKGCCVSQISVGSDGELWATNPPDSLRVLRWGGSGWTWSIPTGMTAVSVGSASNIWALDGSDAIFRWTGSQWSRVPGALHNISAASDGTVWGINSGGVVYRASTGAPGGQLPSDEVIRHYFPKNTWFATGENCNWPWKEASGGVTIFRVSPHPQNPGMALVGFVMLFARDCGHLGHNDALGVDNHWGDGERFYYTLKPDTGCGTGWRLWAMKTVAHGGDRGRRELWQSVPNSCEPPDYVVMSLGKHAVYDGVGDCILRFPSEACTKGSTPSTPTRLFNVVRTDASSPVNDLNAYFPRQPGAGQDLLWGGDGRFCGGHAVSNRSDCVGSPGEHLEFDKLDANFIPDAQRGGDTHCLAGEQYQAGLCYKQCNAGYSGAVTMCVPDCPAGFRDDGLYCFKPGPYGRGAGYPWKFGDGLNDSGMYRRCESDNGPGRCEKWGAVVYPKCKPSYHAVGCCVCSPDCPAHTIDVGISCQKQTYDRGVGLFPITQP